MSINHSIEHILSLPSRRVLDNNQLPANHSIDHILSLPSRRVLDDNLENFFEILEHNEQTTPKFKTTRLKTKCMLKDIWRARDPEAVLLALFEKCMTEAIDRAKAKGIIADKLGIILESDQLDKGPIFLKIQKITEDTLQSILHFFQYWDSYKNNSIVGSQFSIEITAIGTAALREQNNQNNNLQQIEGSSRKRKHFHKSLEHCIVEDGLIKVNNDGNTYCLFYAIELSRRNVTMRNRREFASFRENPIKVRTAVVKLMEKCGISLNQRKYCARTYIPIVQAYFDRKYPQKYRIYLFKKYGQYKPEIITGNPDNERPLSIYFNEDEEHFHAIHKITTFFNCRFYCFSCFKPFSNKNDHPNRCKELCLNCRGLGSAYPCKPDGSPARKCHLCQKTFLNLDCYEKHLLDKICEKFKKCNNCGTIYNLEKNTRNGRDGHKCYETFCHQCLGWHPKRENCFIPKDTTPKKKRKSTSPSDSFANDSFSLDEEILEEEEEEEGNERPYRIVSMDMECTQDNADFDHIPNFIVAHVFCNTCLDNGNWQTPLKEGQCEVCESLDGPFRWFSWSPFKFEGTRFDRKEVTDDPLTAFVDWILKGTNRRYRTLCYSHYGGKYDIPLVFKNILKRDERLSPKLIRNGLKLYKMDVTGYKCTPTVFKDSYNLMPVALAKLKETFGLVDVEQKLWFPHYFNRSVNYNVTLNHLPPKGNKIFQKIFNEQILETYDYNSFTPDKKDQFDEWYQQNFSTPFNLREMLATYCKSDVAILSAALVKFRSIMFEECKFDVLKRCVTISSACLLHFRKNIMPANSIGICNELSYEKHDRQSHLAICYMNWLAKENDVFIQHAHNEGEKVLFSGLKLDGFVPGGLDHRGEADIVEINGCVWHGHNKCYEPQHILPTGLTAEYQYQKTMDRIKRIEEETGIKVTVVWECEIRKELNRNKEMKKFFDEQLDFGPIVLRDALFGGRTEATNLYAKAGQNKTIKYKDFSSLYPSVLYDAEMPLGHGRITVHNQRLEPPWTSSMENPYKGLLKVLVLPPDDIKTPILPYKNQNRLLFPLCRTCCSLYPRGLTKDDYKCNHNNQQRSFVGTYTHIELNKALDSGYKVLYLIRTLNYNLWTTTLFRDYVVQWARIKIEASGWPKNLVTEEEKAEFVAYLHSKGIMVEPTKIERNAGRRSISKLCANSLWGKLSMKNDLSKVEVVGDPARYIQILDDHRLDVNRIEQISKRTLIMTHSKNKTNLPYNYFRIAPAEGFVRENPNCSAIILSIFTTAAARLKLLSGEEKIIEGGGEIHYKDTDSYIYSFPGIDPLPSGMHLGEVIDEYPDDIIVEFVSAGSKQYGLWLRNKITGKERFVLKIRGISLTCDAHSALGNGGDSSSDLQSNSYKGFKEFVLAYINGEEKEPIEIAQTQLKSQRMGGIKTNKIFKKYKPVVAKGVVNKNGVVIPFGKK